jgi:hypothetical protein
MDENMETREQVEQHLVKCETRLKELKGKATTEEMSELENIEGELQSCRLERGEIEHTSGDAWEEAKHGIVRRLNEARRSLNLSARKLI